MAKKQKLSTSESADLQNPIESLLDANVLGRLDLSEVKSQTSENTNRESSPIESSTYKIKGRLVKSGRGLNPVTEIYDWPSHLSDKALKLLLRRLKKSLCIGGTIKNRTIELQGEQFDRASTFLAKEKFKLIRSGG